MSCILEVHECCDFEIGGTCYAAAHYSKGAHSHMRCVDVSFGSANHVYRIANILRPCVGRGLGKRVSALCVVAAEAVRLNM